MLLDSPELLGREEQDWSRGDSSELVWLSDLNMRQLLYREEQDWSSGESSELVWLSDLNTGQLLCREEQDWSSGDSSELGLAIRPEHETAVNVIQGGAGLVQRGQLRKV
jgi:hypothetical protein